MLIPPLHLTLTTPPSCAVVQNGLRGSDKEKEGGWGGGGGLEPERNPAPLVLCVVLMNLTPPGFCPSLPHICQEFKLG